MKCKFCENAGKYEVEVRARGELFLVCKECRDMLLQEFIVHGVRVPVRIQMLASEREKSEEAHNIKHGGKRQG